jgi:hypothetical protein
MMSNKEKANVQIKFIAACWSAILQIDWICGVIFFLSHFNWSWNWVAFLFYEKKKTCDLHRAVYFQATLWLELNEKLVLLCYMDCFVWIKSILSYLIFNEQWNNTLRSGSCYFFIFVTGIRMMFTYTQPNGHFCIKLHFHRRILNMDYHAQGYSANRYHGQAK